MTVVSNTTPLNYLILINEIDILPQLYVRVDIPDAVLQELSSPRAPGQVREWLRRKPDWLIVHSIPPVQDPELEQIQVGERQAILLAQLKQPDFILIDDRRARSAAERRGLNVVGTLGILVSAAKAGLVDLPDALNKLERTTFRGPARLLKLLRTGLSEE
jgi:predicted nucleic acid-binding protein